MDEIQLQRFEDFGSWEPMQTFGAPETIGSLSGHSGFLNRFVLEPNNVAFKEGKVLRFPIYEDNGIIIREMWLYGLRANVPVPPGTSTKPTPDSFFFAFLFSVVEPRIANSQPVIWPGTQLPQRVTLAAEVLDTSGEVIEYNDTMTLSWHCGATRAQIRHFETNERAYAGLDKVRIRPVGGEYAVCP